MAQSPVWGFFIGQILRSDSAGESLRVTPDEVGAMVDDGLRDPLQLDRLIGPVVERMGFDLWGCECRIGGSSAFVRVYIDRAEGISLDDCSAVSHQLSGLLDVEDPIRVPYQLEISSPGLDRPLLKAEHFRRYAGRQVRIKAKWPLDGRRNFVGVLDGLEDDKVVLKAEQTYYLPYDAIERARLVPEF